MAGRTGPEREAVVDTSVLHALLVEEDPHHGPAALLASRIAAVVPSSVVHELVWSLRRRLGAAAAGSRVGWLLARGVRVEPVRLDDVWFALRDPRRYEDLLVVSVARRLGLPLATLDRGMARLAARHGVELLPIPGAPGAHGRAGEETGQA
ncbi:hypothetical protein CF15_01645 [Pyrodictium occultum]|uniref:Ribonuclease VapC n=1 Tax=Pyrodictium occultum TaxID=2309 RepID=A0A0V8RU14_PYROC|nr:PIN domain-containing protein [Pyrodictium occultum]KSW11566.1 hypothetical protein CF15_01645 [Pyrodictium occultum]